ncbi:MAG: Ig-like domain-containing protein, partial [Thermoplasmata archaeon]|nr:Ig-like domain-containing protein [Thermoplasmata archaeon]
LIIDNSTINLTGGNGFDLPKSAAFSSSAWCSGIILNGYVAAGGNATINLTLTNNDTSLTIDNSSLNAKGGDGGDAADGGNGAFGSRGRFGGYTDVNVTDFVGSGGLASVNCDAIIVQITNSTVNILGGNGGNAGDGGFTFDVNAGGGAGAGYSGGNGGSYNGGTGAKGGDVSGRVGAGGFAYLIINGKAVNIIAATLLAQGGNGGNAGNGGDGCYGFSNYGGPGGGGGGYSGGGGGGCKYGGGGSAGSVSEYVGSGGNAFLIINSDYLKVLDNSSLSSVGGNGGSSGIPGEDGFQDTTYTGGYGGKGDYSAMGGPGGGFLGWGPWGTSSLSGQVAYGGNAVFNLTVTNCSISRNTFTERTVGSGVSSGTKYVHIPMSIPIITSPANGSYSETPLALSWIPQYSSTTNGDIEKYNIQIAEDLDFNSIVLDTFINGADSSTYLPTTISGECYWRVSAFYLDSPYFGGWSETRQFTVYSFEPNIALISPSNNSVIFAGSILDFNISDANLNNVNVSINDGINTTFLPPYNISTLGWEDGTYNIEIYAYDDLNNEVVREFIIIVDSSCPVISLVSPLNNSIILRGTVIDIEINDDNLEQANYSLDGIIFQTFDFPYDLDTIDWADEAHTLVIQAIDQANNTAMESYTLTTYSIFPNVASTIPANNSINISVNAEIIIEFSESMNEQSVENAMSFEPIINVSGYSWSLDGKNLTINLLNNLSWNSSYIISVGEGAKDNAGNDLISAYYFSFTTILNSENDNSEEDNSTIPSEIIDTDNDGIDDITDTDDDGDGYLDEWEVILGTNPLDATETPIDTDGDGIPDGDATNSLLWMDSDDDGDDVPDNIDLDPLDSDVGE